MAETENARLVAKLFEYATAVDDIILKFPEDQRERMRELFHGQLCYLRDSRRRLDMRAAADGLLADVVGLEVEGEKPGSGPSSRFDVAANLAEAQTGWRGPRGL